MHLDIQILRKRQNKTVAGALTATRKKKLLQIYVYVYTYNILIHYLCICVFRINYVIHYPVRSG